MVAAASAMNPPRRYPWGDTGAVCRRAAWGLASGPLRARRGRAGHGGRAPRRRFARSACTTSPATSPSGSPTDRRRRRNRQGRLVGRRPGERAAHLGPPGARSGKPRPAGGASLRLSPVRSAWGAHAASARRRLDCASVVRPMTCAVLSIGTELTRGELVNSNAAWLERRAHRHRLRGRRARRGRRRPRAHRRGRSSASPAARASSCPPGASGPPPTT